MFKNREEAGAKLAQALKKYQNQKNCIVIGLARGGVVVAARVARVLHLPLTVLVTRKVGAPEDPELALGAVMESGDAYLNKPLIQALGVSKSYLEKAVKDKQIQAAEKQAVYARHMDPISVKDQTVILVDDGIATGASIFAAIQAIRKQKPHRVIVAAPVGASSPIKILKTEVDEVVYLEIEDRGSVSMSYEQFPQIEDEEVIALLDLFRN